MSFKHKKKFGQNFLNDQNVILQKIIEVSNITKEDSVLEIGPGEGALTELLLANSKKVLNIEIDRDLEKKLRNKFKEFDNYELIIDDVLNVDLKPHLEKGTKVIANIPYYITSPIINKIIDNRDLIDEAYLMVQKEVGKRITSKKGKSRGILTLAIEYYGEAEYLFDVPKEFFTPVPNVDSAFISIKLFKDERNIKIVNPDLYFYYIKGTFSNKRKNIVNNLITLGFEKEQVKNALDNINISHTERAENLSFVEFVSLIEEFERIKSGENE